MIIKGKKVYLKKGFSDREFSSLLKWFNDIEVMRYISFAKKALTFRNIKEVKCFLYRIKDATYFGVYTNKSKRFIGYSVIQNFNNKKCQFAIIIGNKNYWGKGIGTEVIKIIIYYSFKFGLEKIYLTTSEYNKNAIKLYKKTGFKIKKTILKDRQVYPKNKWVKSATICMELNKKGYKK